MSGNENAKAKVSEKSDFTRRCSLLSRYLREKGSFGNVDLGLYRKPNSGKSDPQGKQDELQKGEQSKAKENVSESESESSQLTIFFGGKIIVYNEFPADKAKEIIEVAKQVKPVTDIKVENNNNNNKSDMVLPDLNQPSNSVDTDHTHPTKEQLQQQNQLVERIARRASLHRFFAKRKDRAVARAPYQVNQNTGHHPPKPETDAGKSLEPGQSSQRPDNVVDQKTMAHPKPNGDKDVSMEIEEGQSSKDLELRL